MDFTVESARRIESATDILESIKPTSISDDILNSIMEGFKRDSISKTKSVSTSVGKRKRSLDAIEKDIQYYESDILTRERAIEHEMTIVEKTYSDYERLKNKALDTYNRKMADILLNAGTKDSLEQMVLAKQREIDVLQNRIADGDYNIVMDSESESLLKKEYSDLAKKLSNLEYNYKNYADDKLTKTINGSGEVVDGKTTRKGLRVVIEDNKKMLEQLYKERDEIMKEGSKSVDEMEKELKTNSDAVNQLDALFDSIK